MLSKEFAITHETSRNINPNWFRVRVDELVQAYIWAEKHGVGDYHITTSYMIFEKERDAVYCKLKFGVQ